MTQPGQSGPDQSRPGRVTLRFILWYVTVIGSIGALHPYLAVVLSRAGASGRELALVLLIFPVGLLLVGPAWAWVADRTGRSLRVLRLSLFFAVVGAGWMATADTWMGMLPGIVLVALSRVSCVSLVDVLVVRHKRLGPKRYGPIRLWGSIGFMAGAFATGYWLDTWWRAPLAASAALLALGFGVSFLLPSPASTSASGPAERPPLSSLLRNRALMGLYLVAVVHIATISSYDSLFGLHAESVHMAQGLVGAAVALGVFAEVVVMALGHRLLGRFSARTLILIGLVSGIPRWLLTGGSDTPWILVATQSLHGLGFGAFWIGGVAWIHEHAPDRLRNTAQSLFLASGWGLGSLLALSGAAVWLDDAGSGRFFLALTGFSGLALVLGMGLLRDAPVSSPETRTGTHAPGP